MHINGELLFWEFLAVNETDRHMTKKTIESEMNAS